MTHQNHIETAGGPTARETPRKRVLGWERMLVPVDFTPASVDAVKYAASVAQRDGSSLCLLHVVDHVSGVDDRNLFYSVEEAGEMAERRLARLASWCVPREVPVRALVQRGQPAREILQAAESLDCDAIVLSPHRHGWLRRLWDAGTARRVFEKARCHVLMVNSPNADKTDPTYWDVLEDRILHAKESAKE